EIKKAYKKAALTHHPDKGGDADKFKECGAAVETLTDERKRAAYDSTLIRLRSKDGLGGGVPRFARDSSADRRPPGPAPAPAPAQKPPAPKPAPKPSGAVEIPSDPSSLSIKELKELLSALGIDHENCLEKADLLSLLRDRKDWGRAGVQRAAEAAARAGAQRAAGYAQRGPSVAGEGHVHRLCYRGQEHADQALLREPVRADEVHPHHRH
ncbi:unnamed protein product, partial [Effrenium voratum]